MTEIIQLDKASVWDVLACSIDWEYSPAEIETAAKSLGLETVAYADDEAFERVIDHLEEHAEALAAQMDYKRENDARYRDQALF